MALTWDLAAALFASCVAGQAVLFGVQQLLRVAAALKLAAGRNAVWGMQGRFPDTSPTSTC